MSIAVPPAATVAEVERHLTALRDCAVCPAMHRPAVVGRATPSRILLVGQAPGDKEPRLGRPFAWTAGRTLFDWLQRAVGWTEEDVRNRIYFAAVCRCFPGKRPAGGDRVPDAAEIANCRPWLQREFALLSPTLVLPVGKLAIQQFLPAAVLQEVIGRVHPIEFAGQRMDCLPLPHPSGASTWHRTEPGRTRLAEALRHLATHPAVIAAGKPL